MRSFILFLTLLLSISNLSSADFQWEEIQPPPSDTLYNLALDSSGNYWGRSIVNQLYVKKPGEIWRIVNPGIKIGLINNIFVSPGNTVFVSTEANLIKSADSENWSEVPLPAHSMSANYTTINMNGTLYCGRVYTELDGAFLWFKCSFDEGNTWEGGMEGESFYFTFAPKYDYVSISLSMGMSWKNMESSDFGKTWHDFKPIDNIVITRCLEIEYYDGYLFYLGALEDSEHGYILNLYYSEDYGQIWKVLATYKPKDGIVLEHAPSGRIVPLPDKKIFIGIHEDFVLKELFDDSFKLLRHPTNEIHENIFSDLTFEGVNILWFTNIYLNYNGQPLTEMGNWILEYNNGEWVQASSYDEKIYNPKLVGRTKSISILVLSDTKFYLYKGHGAWKKNSQETIVKSAYFLDFDYDKLAYSKFDSTFLSLDLGKSFKYLGPIEELDEERLYYCEEFFCGPEKVLFRHIDEYRLYERNGNLYMEEFNSHIQRSLDEGDSWEYIFNVAIDLADMNRNYEMAGGVSPTGKFFFALEYDMGKYHLQMSADNGTSFESYANGLPDDAVVNDIIFDNTGSANILLTTKGLFIDFNNNNWLEIGPPDADTLNFGAIDRAGRLWAIDSGGRLFKSVESIYTDIEQETQQETLAYPIPAEEILNIRLEKEYLIKSVTAVDINGNKSALEFDISGNTINTRLSHLTHGLYILQIKTNNGVIIRKILKE